MAPLRSLQLLTAWLHSRIYVELDRHGLWTNNTGFHRHYIAWSEVRDRKVAPPGGPGPIRLWLATGKKITLPAERRPQAPPGLRRDLGCCCASDRQQATQPTAATP